MCFLAQEWPASDVCVAEFAWEEASWARWHARRERHDNGEPWDDSARLWACLVGFAAAVYGVPYSKKSSDPPPRDGVRPLAFFRVAIVQGSS